MILSQTAVHTEVTLCFFLEQQVQTALLNAIAIVSLFFLTIQFVYVSAEVTFATYMCLVCVRLRNVIASTCGKRVCTTGPGSVSINFFRQSYGVLLL